MRTSKLGLLLVTATLSLVGCAASAEEDEADQAGAISSEEAASEWKGARKVLKGHVRAIPTLGIESWDVYLVKTGDFTGTVAVAVGGDGHVRHAVISGTTGDGKPSVALANYDVDGKTGPTERDAEVLRRLNAELAHVFAAASADGIAQTKCALDVSGLLVGSAAVAAAITFAPVTAALGAVLAITVGVTGVAGAAIVGFKVGDIAMSAIQRTRCFASR